MKWIAVAALLASATQAAELKPQTMEAFDRYVRQAEQRLDARTTFLWADESPARAQRVRQGDIVIEPLVGKGDLSVSGGLVHDWVGAVFIAGRSLQKTISLMQDYDHKTYHQEVVGSRIVARNGNDIEAFMRLRKHKVITVVLDTWHDIHYVPIDETRWRSRSTTTKIAEVEGAGTPEEKILPPGTGQGFLWKLNTYWRFEERDGGTWVECEAVSLTRDVPTGLGWLIEPIIRTLPRESLESTLRETRKALVK
jgi:hypothetical protein